MKTYILYGCKSNLGIREIRKSLEGILAIKFDEHESLYRGEYFRSGITRAENLVLQNNFDEQDNEWAEPDHQIYPVLLYINATARADKLGNMLESLDGWKKLKQETL